MTKGRHVSVLLAAICATGATVTFRVLAIIFNWKTREVEESVQSP